MSSYSLTIKNNAEVVDLFRSVKSYKVSAELENNYLFAQNIFLEDF